VLVVSRLRIPNPGALDARSLGRGKVLEAGLDGANVEIVGHDRLLIRT
jgi:hypothetical protein